MCKAQLQKTHRRILVVCSHQLKSFKSPCGHQCLFDNSIYMAEQLWKSNRTVAMKKAFTPVPLLRACHDMFCFQFHLTIQWTKDPWRNMPWKMICHARSPRPRGPSWQSFCNSLPICPSIHKVLWQLFSTRPRSLEYQIYTVATTKKKQGFNSLMTAMEELWVH